MAGGLQFIDGRLQYVGDGTEPYAPDDQFFDPSVPGAAQAQPQLDNTPQVEAAMGAVQEEEIQAAQAEQTEQQKAEQEVAKKQEAAKLQALKAKQEAIKAEGKLAEAGYSPENQQVLPNGLGATTPDAVSGADQLNVEQPTEEVQPEGQALVDQGFTDQIEATREAGTSAAFYEEAKAIAASDTAGEALAQLEVANGIQGQRDEIKAKLADIDAQIQGEINTNVKKPTPSALALVGVFLNGLIAPQQGGKNAALDIVQRKMQRETNLALENKRSRISGLEKKRVVTGDMSDEISREAVASDIMMAKKLKAFSMQMQAGIDQKYLPEAKVAEMKQLIGQIEVLQGQHQMKASQAAAEQFRRQQETNARLAAAQAKAASKGRGGSGSGRGKTTRVPIGQPGGPTAVWDPFQRTLVDPTDVKSLKNKKLAGLGTAVNLGIKIKTPVGTTDAAILPEKQQMELVSDINGRNEVRQRALITQDALDWVIEEGGEGAGSALERRLSEMTGVSSDAKRALNQSVAQITDSAKRISGAGASLTENELKIIVNQVFGTNPESFIKDNNLGQIKDAIGRYQEQTDHLIRQKLSNTLGVKPSDVSFKEADFTRSVRNARKKQPAASVEQMHGNAQAVVKELNDQFTASAEAPGIAAVPEASYKDLETQVNLIATSYEAGAGATSKGAKTGGKVGIGQQEFMLAGLLKDTKDPKAKKIIKRALARVSKEGKAARAKAKAKKRVIGGVDVAKVKSAAKKKSAASAAKKKAHVKDLLRRKQLKKLKEL